MRNVRFASQEWEPTGPSLKLRKGSVAGPLPFLNPTTALYDIKSNNKPGGKRRDLSDLEDLESRERAKVRWNARDYRKGRYVLVVPRNSPIAKRFESGTHPHSVLRGIARMFTLFPYWDVSWLIGISFTIGCLIFVACGCFYWLPIAYPETEFAGEEKYAGGLTSFVGATLFQVGAFLLFFESYNDRAETQFGGAVEHLFVDRLKIGRRSRNHRPKHFNADQCPEKYDPGDETFEKIDKTGHKSPSDNVKTDENQSSKSEDASPFSFPPQPKNEGAKTSNEDVTPTSETTTLQQTRTETEASELPGYGDSDDVDDSDQDAIGETNVFTQRKWKWYPSWHDVRNHYIYEIGFLASFTMSLGATIFWICGILSIPGLFQSLSDTVVKVMYYGPYLIGGILFFVSSVLYVLENQPNWYTPQLDKIGWHVGFWNMVGGIGWTYAAALGYGEASWCEYQSELALIWASAAFSLGSGLQWYESLDKYVIVIGD